MKKYIPSLKALIPFGILCLLAGIFSFTANADSTITIPIQVPKNYPDRNVKLQLRIPPSAEPLTRKEQAKPAINANRIIIWNSNPAPNIANNDELYSIFGRMYRKGWIKGLSARNAYRSRPIDKYHALQILLNICDSIIELGQAPNFTKAVKKVNLTASDIEDVRRMIKRFEKDLYLFGALPHNLDRDLLTIQELLKKNSEGILRVIKVEGMPDGATIIHMTVD